MSEINPQVHCYLRLPSGSTKNGVDFLILYFEPFNILDELEVIQEALNPAFICISHFAEDTHQMEFRK